MPILSGLETLIELRKSFPELLVIVLTMHNNEAFILKMMELGANGYLIKNAEPNEMINAIRKVLSTKFYFSEQVSRAMLAKIKNPQKILSPEKPVHVLTSREIDVLRLICKEYTTIEIGKTLFISPKTVEGCRKNLMAKTSAKNMAGLVLFAVKHGIHDISS